MMKMAGIREFRQRLSRYLHSVRQGETVWVTDRGEVVAEVKAPGRAQGRDVRARFADAVARGLIQPAKRSQRQRKRKTLWRGFR